MRPYRIFSAISFVVVLSLNSINLFYITPKLNHLNETIIKVQSIGRQIYIDQALLLDRMDYQLEKYDYSTWEVETKYINHYIEELEEITLSGLLKKNYWKETPLTMSRVVEFDSDLNGVLATEIDNNNGRIESLKIWQEIMFISTIGIIVLAGFLWIKKFRIDKRNDEWYILNKKGPNESKK